MEIANAWASEPRASLYDTNNIPARIIGWVHIVTENRDAICPVIWNPITCQTEIVTNANGCTYRT